MRPLPAHVRAAMRPLAFLLVLAAACHAPESAEPRDAGPRAEVGAVQPSPPPPPFPASVRSLRLTRSVTVKLGPDGGSKNLGTVAENTLVGYRGAARGPGCKLRWIAIEPRGYVCESFLAPSERAPAGVELPRLGRGELVPGEYGKLAGAGIKIVKLVAGHVTSTRTLDGSAMVRRYDEVVVDGVPSWRISADEFVRASAVQRFVPSGFHGVRLGDETGHRLPLGFALAAARPREPVVVYRAADLAHPSGARLAARTAIDVLEVAERDGAATAYRIGDDAWLAAADVRLAELAAPPASTRPGERWIDVDLDRQILVAYEGDQPVYATLVSSGAKLTPTPTGTYRVWIKFAETNMSGQMADQPAYSVATVPWTQYFAKDLALHTTYWHDRLGEARSHGCINLAPIDARFLYFWSAPDLPAGWSMADGVIERPGSIVRVRSAADPTPAFQGYAATMAGVQAPPPTGRPGQ